MSLADLSAATLVIREAFEERLTGRGWALDLVILGQIKADLELALDFIESDREEHLTRCALAAVCALGLALCGLEGVSAESFEPASDLRADRVLGAPGPEEPAA